MQMELRPKSNLATKPQNDEDFQIAATENQEMNEPMVEQDTPLGQHETKNSKKQDVKNEGKTSLRTRL